MFSILINDGGPLETGGRIQIGSTLDEAFLANLEYWTPQQYRLHWQRELGTLVAGGAGTALISSMPVPSTGNFVFWWPIYRVANSVFVQNHVLFLEELDGSFEPNSLAKFVPNRRTMSEDGEPISEWCLDIGSIEEFLATKKWG